jgi:opacity protein-like surface antigen
MSAKRLWIAFLLAATILVAAAAGQNNELAGGIGRTFIADQGIAAGPVPLTNNVVHFGNGLSFEINYARRLLHGGILALDGEIPFVANPDEDLGSGNGAVPAQYSSYFITPSARLKVFPESHFQPWVSVGGGYGRFNISDTQVYGGSNPGPKSKSSGLLQMGFGLDTGPWQKVALRLAVRDFWSSALPLNVDTGKDHQHNIVVTGGIVFRF